MPRDVPDDDDHVISLTTVLILSAFLIGLAVGNVLSPDLEPYVLSCGVSGLLAYVALELAAQRRRQEALDQEKRHVEDRLDRHVLSQSNASFALPPPRRESAASSK